MICNNKRFSDTGTTEIIHNPSYELLFSEETKIEWEEKAKNLAMLFKENFSKYENNPEVKNLVNAGPSL